jgi:hypothetical protein
MNRALVQILAVVTAEIRENRIRRKAKGFLAIRR